MRASWSHWRNIITGTHSVGLGEHLVDHRVGALAAKQGVDHGLIDDGLEGSLLQVAEVQHVHDPPVHVRVPLHLLADHHLAQVHVHHIREPRGVHVRRQVGVAAPAH